MLSVRRVPRGTIHETRQIRCPRCKPCVTPSSRRAHVDSKLHFQNHLSVATLRPEIGVFVMKHPDH
jgi:hypothetical protein